MTSKHNSLKTHTCPKHDGEVLISNQLKEEHQQIILNQNVNQIILLKVFLICLWISS